MEPLPEPETALAILSKDYQSIKDCLDDRQCEHTPTQITELICNSLMLIEEELMVRPSSEIKKMRKLFTHAMQKFHRKWNKTSTHNFSTKKGGGNRLKARRTPLKEIGNNSRKFGFNPSPEKLLLIFNFLKKMGRIHFEYNVFELMFFGSKKLTKAESYDGPAYELVRIFYKFKQANVIVQTEYIQAICSNFTNKKGQRFNADSLNSMTGVILPNGGEEKLEKLIKILKAE